MKRRSILVASICMLLMLCLGGCGDLSALLDDNTNSDSSNGGGNTGGGSDVSSGVSFDNFSTRSVSVKNNTGEKLIAFKGEISPSALISGVPAHASNHGLKKDSQLFSATGDFALIFITEEQYNTNKSDLSALMDASFARVYAFYNASGSNDNVYEISSKSGGSAKLVLNNNSDFNVEIRMNGPAGEVLGYVPANTVNTVLNVDPDDYTLFPIFKKYISRDNEIYSIKPVFTQGVAIGKPYSYDIGITGRKTWNVGDIYDPADLKLTAGGFYLTINNQNAAGIRFTKGLETYKTSTGLSTIDPSTQQMFFIPFGENQDGTFPASLPFSQLKVGSTNYPQAIPDQNFENNKKYLITVTGTDASDITLSSVTDEGVVDIDRIFDL